MSSIDLSAVEKIVQETKVSAAAAEEARLAAEIAQRRAESDAAYADEAIKYEANAPNRPSFEYDGNVLSYATEAEILAFANTVREAGGATVLEALLPSIQTNAKECLIANALNFGCRVDTAAPSASFGDPAFNDGRYPHVLGPRDERRWYMHLPAALSDEQIEALVEATGLPVVGERTYGNEIGLVLPYHIGNAALAFDNGKGWTRDYIGRY